MLDGIGLRGVVRMVGVMVRVGGRGREGLGEREGGILSLYILGMVSCSRRIDIGCMADRGLPSRRAGGVRIWIRRRWIVRPIGTVSGTCAVESIIRVGWDYGVCLGIFAPLVGALGGAAGSRHRSMEGCEFLHHLLVEIWLVCVYSLGMLSEVVEAGELLRAVALEGAFAGMLSNVKSEYRERLVQRESRKCRGLVVNGNYRVSESKRMDRSVCIWLPHYEMHTGLAGYLQGCTRL